MSSSRPRIPIVTLGAASAIAQTLAVREALATLGGNEAVIATVFGAWLLLTALGAQAGRLHGVVSHRTLAFGFLLYAVSLPLTLAAARGAVVLAPVGVDPGWSTIAPTSAAILAPACLLSGWLYAGLTRMPPQQSSQDPLGEAVLAARAYALDTFGSAAAGIALALLLLDRMLPFAIMGVATALALVAAATLLAGVSRILAASSAVFALLASTLLPLDLATLPWQVSGQRVLGVSMSPRGAIVVAERDGQTQLLLHRSAFMTSAPSSASEQIGLLSASLVDAPRDVLVVGVAPAFALRSLRSMGATRIDEVVGDPGIADQVRIHAPDAADPGVTVLGQDERAFVRSLPPQAYDLAIVCAPPPTSIGMGRLYSKELYAGLKRAIRPAGVVVVTMPGHASYANREQRMLHSAVAATLRSEFPAVLALPADVTLYVASSQLPDRSAVASAIAARLPPAAAGSTLVTPDWVRTTFTPERVADATRWSAAQVPPSTDCNPIVFQAALDVALSQLGDVDARALGSMVGAMVLLVLVWARPRVRPVAFAVGTTGFAGLALQLLLMIVYQAAVGALYRDVALIGAVFMGCTGVASWCLSSASFSKWKLVAADAAQAVAAIAAFASIGQMLASEAWVARGMVAGLAAVVGAATGSQIAFASRAPGAFPQATGAAVFGADLAGAAVAAAAIQALVVPALGLAGTAIMIAAVKLTSTIALALPPKRASSLAPRGALPLVALASVVFAAAFQATGNTLYAWTSSTAFSLIVLATIAIELAAGLQPSSWRDRMLVAERTLRTVSQRVGISPLRLISFLVLLPVAALPIARCYFRIPYLFCHSCPRPCTFGLVRPYVVTGALLCNVGDHRFCERVCPLGHVQQSIGRMRGRAGLRLGRAGAVARVALLVAVAVAYFAVRGASRSTAEADSVFAWAFSDAYVVSAATVTAALLLVAASFVVRRPFCDAVCPIGAVSDLVARAERTWVNRSRA